ncbi:MAG: tetratricopeptide repeat protein [Caldilineaceae bacterium]
MTQIARTQALQAHFEPAHATLDEAEKLLQPDWTRAHIRYCLERGRVYNSSGHVDAARSLFLDAWELTISCQCEDALAIDAAHMIAIVEPPSKQLDWNLQALAMAERSSDEKAKRWKASLYNNIGWTYHDQGEYEKALDCFQKALAERQAQKSEAEIRIARWCVARTLRSLNRIDESLAMQQALLADFEASGEKDGFVNEEIAECLLLQGRQKESMPHFARAYELLSKDIWLARNEAARLERLLNLSEGNFPTN